MATVLVLLELAACATVTPVHLEPRFSANATSYETSEPKRQPFARRCRVVLTGVADKRTDWLSAGALDGRQIEAEDAPEWVRSGLMTLAADPRLALDEHSQPEAADLIMSGNLLKVYMLQINEAKSANVVVRMRFASAKSSVVEKIYRGVQTSMDWAGPSVAQGALNEALAKLIAAVHRDVIDRCVAELASEGRPMAQIL